MNERRTEGGCDLAVKHFTSPDGHIAEAARCRFYWLESENRGRYDASRFMDSPDT